MPRPKAFGTGARSLVPLAVCVLRPVAAMAGPTWVEALSAMNGLGVDPVFGFESGVQLYSSAVQSPVCSLHTDTINRHGCERLRFFLISFLYG